MADTNIGKPVNINAVLSDATLDTSYANPGPLPVCKAKASLDGDIIMVFLELRAGGYNGSTYQLTHDKTSDTLQCIYYQAVAQQEFAVYFERVN